MKKILISVLLFSLAFNAKGDENDYCDPVTRRHNSPIRQKMSISVAGTLLGATLFLGSLSASDLSVRERLKGLTASLLLTVGSSKYYSYNTQKLKGQKNGKTSAFARLDAIASGTIIYLGTLVGTSLAYSIYKHTT